VANGCQNEQLLKHKSNVEKRHPIKCACIAFAMYTVQQINKTYISVLSFHS